MLSVLSVAGVEKRIGNVGGVESVTVNYAAGNATVRYDETRLDIADIKADVSERVRRRQCTPGWVCGARAGCSGCPGSDARCSAENTAGRERRCCGLPAAGPISTRGGAVGISKTFSARVWRGHGEPDSLDSRRRCDPGLLAPRRYVERQGSHRDELRRSCVGRALSQDCANEMNAQERR